MKKCTGSHDTQRTEPNRTKRMKRILLRRTLTKQSIAIFISFFFSFSPTVRAHFVQVSRWVFVRLSLSLFACRQFCTWYCKNELFLKTEWERKRSNRKSVGLEMTRERHFHSKSSLHSIGRSQPMISFFHEMRVDHQPRLQRTSAMENYTNCWKMALFDMHSANTVLNQRTNIGHHPTRILKSICAASLGFKMLWLIEDDNVKKRRRVAFHNFGPNEEHRRRYQRRWPPPPPPSQHQHQLLHHTKMMKMISSCICICVCAYYVPCNFSHITQVCMQFVTFSMDTLCLSFSSSLLRCVCVCLCALVIFNLLIFFCQMRKTLYQQHHALQMTTAAIHFFFLLFSLPRKINRRTTDEKK